MSDKEEENFFDDVIDTYFSPMSTTVFDRISSLAFPSKHKVLNIMNKDTQVSIFFEKRSIEHTVVILDGDVIRHINNFVFLYKFKGLENGGAAVVQSFLDKGKAKLHEDYADTERDFNKMHNGINRLKNHRLIYHGARNEG